MQKPRAMLKPSNYSALADPSNIDPSGVTTFISWDRLESELRRSGTIHNREKIATFVIEDRGITLRLEKR